MPKAYEENEGKPHNIPKAKKDHPSREVPPEAEGNP